MSSNMFNRLIEIPHIKSGSQLKGLDDGLPSASLGRVMFFIPNSRLSLYDYF